MLCAREQPGRRSRTVRVSVTPTSLMSMAEATSLSRSACRGARNFSAGMSQASLATSRSTAVRTSSMWWRPVRPDVASTASTARVAAPTTSVSTNPDTPRTATARATAMVT